MGLYFSQSAPTEILVETIEKRKIATQIAIKWHSSIILDGIENQLKIEDKTRQGKNSKDASN